MVERHINPSLLEPQPTVLEIRGFTPGTLVEIQKIFVASLQQPSYVSRAIVKSSDLSNRTASVESLLLTCPFGFALNLLQVNDVLWRVTEKSPCCLSEFRKGACVSCGDLPTVSILEDIYVHPARDHAPLDAVQADPDVEVDEGDSNMQELEDRIIARLERQNIETFSAFLIACELRALIFELVRFNEVNTFAME